MSIPADRNITSRAKALLSPLRKSNPTTAEIIKTFRSFLRDEETRLRFLHRGGAGGIDVAEKRSALIDITLEHLYRLVLTLENLPKEPAPFTLVAVGGYGRGALNPASDVDLLFLLPGKNSLKLEPKIQSTVERIFLLLTDIRLKLGHAVRTVDECVQEANTNNETKTSLIEARFILGDEALYKKFTTTFKKHCLKAKETEYLLTRQKDVQQRHAKYSNTVYLQEPHVKNGCGALRDYQNICWIAYVKKGYHSLAELHKNKLLSTMAYREMEKAYDFLHRVRNELHYLEKRPSDTLTLRLQGRVATYLKYPQKRMLDRIEAFMRDYYHHTRNLYQHTTSLLERFDLEMEEEKKTPLSFLARGRKSKTDKFDGFYSQGGFIYPESDRVFKEDSSTLMRLFQHTQQRHLQLSPQIRQLVKLHYALIDKSFRYRKANRETFEAILSRKGDVGRVLRQMHRVGFLGRYLPEFGALTDLVQHEFFHRYSADEHTLRVIEQLDALVDLKPRNKTESLLKELFQDLEDPYSIYLAILMHDAGRATEHKHHEYGSAMLASQLCRRLQVDSSRRSLIGFLVDHHLSLWRTATTKNLEEPAVIEEFASIVKTQARLDALFLMTYADSKGTNETSWSGFKESLMVQLYHMTSHYLRDRTSLQAEFTKAANDDFRREVAEKLGPGWEEEIAQHFQGMPERYFVYRSAHRVASQLRLFRQFFKHQAQADDDEKKVPTYRWREQPERGCSELTLVAHDRHLLLARLAACLSACRLNILSADFFLRADGIVFDIFRVCTTRFEPVTDERVLRKFARLIHDVFRDDHPDLMALLPPPDDDEDPALIELQSEFPTRLYISNHLSPQHTVVEFDAVDRLGLLSRIFLLIGRLNLEIAHARINTEKGAALDTLYLTTREGGKIDNPDTLQALEKGLHECLLGPYSSASVTA